VRDTVLRGLADRLRAATRADDLCARYGGEEFALVLIETGHADAVATAERVRAAVACEPFRFDGRELRLTASVGVATADGGAEVEPTNLLRDADARLYRAKAGGRDRVVGATGDVDAIISRGDPLSTVVCEPAR
jgi:diguanylate cyclase (GGDEF)-like protein